MGGSLHAPLALRSSAQASFTDNLARHCGVIDSISSQTDILVLNAAVEAARARENIGPERLYKHRTRTMIAGVLIGSAALVLPRFVKGNNLRALGLSARCKNIDKNAVCVPHIG